MEKILFDVLIDSGFADICTNPDLTPINNKSLLSLLNDFEEGRKRLHDDVLHISKNR